MIRLPWGREKKTNKITCAHYVYSFICVMSYFLFKNILLKRASTHKVLRMSIHFTHLVGLAGFWLGSTAPACLRRWHCSRIHPWWTEKCRKTQSFPVNNARLSNQTGIKMPHTSTSQQLMARHATAIERTLHLIVCTQKMVCNYRRRWIKHVVSDSSVANHVYVMLAPSQPCVDATSHLHFQIYI